MKREDVNTGPSVELQAEQLRQIAGRLAALPEDKQQRFLAQLAEKGLDPSKLPIVAGPRPEHLPLSHAQERLWFIEQLDPGNALYNLATILELRGPLDVPALEHTLRALVQRHESLRTVFGEVDGRPVQVVANEPLAAIDQIDLSELPADERTARAAELRDEEAQRSFDLRNGPLARMKLLRLGPDEHWLLITLHHIISDEWSEEVLTREFIELYGAFRAGRAPTLAPLVIQYPDYALWQRRGLSARQREQELAYWKGVLGTADAPLLLPTDFPRTGAPSERGADHTFVVDGALTRALRELSQGSDTTLFTTVLAAFHILLQRYTGQADIRVGTPVAGRTRAELESLIGLFANTVVLKSHVSARLRFLDYLSCLRSSVADARANQDLPFEELASVLKPERRLDHSPLFQIMFSWHVDSRTAEGKLDGLEIVQRQPVERVSKFDLTLHVTDAENELEAQLIYRTDLFKPETIATMAERLVVLLRAIAKDPALSIARLGWLGTHERGQLLGFSSLEPLLAPSSGAHELIAAQVQHRPDALAVRCEQETLQYAELETRANRLASFLRERGVGLESRVLLCLPRSVDLITALYAVLKCGAAYVPLEPKLPPARLREMALDSGARLVLSHSQFGDVLRGTDVDLVQLDEPSFRQQWLERSSGHEGARDTAVISTRIHPESSAYVIYTSGSTGRPKGVIVTHRGLASYVSALLQRVALPEGGSLAMASTIAADLGNTALFGALCSGRAVHLISEERMFDPDSFAEYMQHYGVDALKIVPSHLAGLLKAERPERVLPRHTLIVGGEATSWELVERIARLGACRIVNHYGPTETTVGVLTHAHETGAPFPASSALPLGRPLVNSRVQVLDGGLQPAPIGVTGEIYIGGHGVARGYLGRGDLTADRFIPDPYHAGERLYRTGDRARYLHDGSIEFLGRSDNQIKLRGYRVELGEIVAELCALPEVSQAEVLVHENRAGSARLVAYLVATGEQRDSSALTATLAARLPEHMVPSDFVWLERFPLTDNGKLDRAALPAAVQTETERVLPRTEIEEKLAAIWREVLKLEAVGVFDNFFKLGGDSILTLQVIARARKAGIKLTPKQLFAHQTIAEAACVAELVARAPRAPAELVSGNVELTPVQRWFFEQNLAEAQHWNQSVLLELAEPLDRKLLDQAVAELTREHDALRLCFRREHGRWQQRYAGGEQSERYRYVDLSAVADVAAAIEQVANESQRSLDLERGPLFRIVYLDFGAARSGRLLLVAHHLVVDGVSWRILLEDLRSSYAALSAGQALPVRHKTTSFQRWSALLQSYARSAELEAERGYWREVVGQDEPELPLAHPQGINSVASLRTVSVVLTELETKQLLTEVGEPYRMQPSEVLITALAETLCEWAGLESVLVQLEGHGREDLFEDVELARTVGWFTTLYPVRLRPQLVDAGASLRSVKEQLRAVPNKGIGYGVLRYLGESSRLAAGAMPRVNFNYWGQVDQAFDALFRPAAEPGGDERSPDGLRSSWFDVSAMVLAGRLEVSLGYSSALHSEEDAALLAGRYAERLRQLIQHCLGESAGALTPSDFRLARLSDTELATLPFCARDVEDIYPLSPMQQGMLFHSVLEPSSSVYVNQRTCELRASLEVPLLQQAWQRALQTHAILRTAFVWEGVREPLQVVLRRAELPFRLVDCRGKTDSEQQRELAELLERERAHGAQLGSPPLMRVVVVRWDERRYQLIWTSHHLLLDGWSSAQLLTQILTDYAALTRGVAAALERRGSYRDYIAWLGRQDHEKTLQFWREQLESVSEPSLLATHVPAGRSGSTFATLALSWSPELNQALGEFAREQHVTLNTLFQGALGLLLSTLLRQADVVLGITVSGRGALVPAIEHTLGLFINTLPLRVRVFSEQAVSEWLRALQAQGAGLREHESAPLVELQKLTRLPPGTPLFDTLLVFENYPVAQALDASAEALGIERLSSVESTNYPLTVAVSPGEALLLELHYDRQLFDEARVVELADQLEGILRAFVAAPAAKLRELPLLGSDQRQQVLVGWNATHSDYPSQRCIHEIFEEQAARAPEAVAVIHGRDQLSYGELNARSNRLARRLRELGVGPEVLVGVYLERSLLTAVALLAILKAGGAYVPLDPAYPSERVHYMLADARPRLVLTSERLAAGLPGEQQLYLVDEGLPELAAGAAENLPSLSRPLNLAYCIYTSGSTGKPKAALLTHSGLVSNLHWTKKAFGLTSADRVAQLASLSFDASVWEFWLALFIGGACVLPTHEASRDAGELVVELKRCGVSVMLAIPSLLMALLETGEGRAALAELSHVFSGGEAMPPELARRLLELKIAHVVNLYGPTEATVDVTAFDCTASTFGESVPIGRPIGNTSLYILDPQLRPVPPGVAGELYVGGVGLARGYLDRPELSAERFVPNPYSELPGQRLYRTGDLASYRADGAIEFRGRVDRQVKIRGYRIELAEIESRLRQQDEVEDAVVLAREDAPGEKRLVAYVVPADSALASASREQREQLWAELQARLAAALPEYMVPRLQVFLESLPLAPSGKVDHRALPRPDLNQAHKPSAPPRSELEAALASIFQELLRLENVGIFDNFFELGGDSIVALQVVARAKAAGIEVTPKDLFQHPTVGALGAVARLRTTEAQEQGPVSGTVELTPIQRWFFEEPVVTRQHWNQSLLLEVAQQLDFALLKQAASELCSHHDALRLRFRPQGLEFEQWYSQDEHPDTCWRVDLWSETDRTGAIERIVNEAQRSLNLENGPLFRVVYLDAGTERAGRLLLVAHHLVVDAVSWRIVLEDLQTLYRNLGAGHAPGLPAKTSSWQRWSRALHEYATSDRLKLELPYWREVVEDAANGSCQASSKGENSSEAARTLSFELSAAETEQLFKQALPTYRADISSALLAALSYVLCSWSDDESVLVNLEGHGREDLFEGMDVSRTVGWFTSLYPVRLAPDRESVARSVARIKEQLRQVPNKGIGYGVLRYLSPEGAELEPVTKPAVMFNYLGKFEQAFEDSGLFRLANEASGDERHPKAERPSQFEVSAAVYEGRLRVDWRYGSQLHAESVVSALVAEYQRALQELIRASQQQELVELVPSDFQHVSLAQDELNDILGDLG